MKSILINGISAKVGGGKSILVNFLSLLKKSDRKDKFVVVVSCDFDISAYKKDNIQFIPLKNTSFYLLRFYLFEIKKIVIKYNVAVILNLADIIIPISTKQIYLFDWPYAIYPESIVWKKMSWNEWLFRKFKLLIIVCYIKLPVLISAQTKVAEERLKRLYSVKNVEVIPNAVSVDNLLEDRAHRNFNFSGDKTKFLYLTKYYPHKNIEVLLFVARIIRERNLPYIIVITIDESQHPDAKDFLNRIKAEKLDQIIINVGPVEMKNVPSLYQQTDAYLMPSLLESFSGTYVEAMHHSKPIFTSNYDFAKAVCGDAAFYFDPLNAHSIIESIIQAYNEPGAIAQKISIGKERLNTFLTWENVFERFLKIIDTFYIEYK